jgi:uncharacterized protein YjgD (DUF1641 family)
MVTVDPKTKDTYRKYIGYDVDPLQGKASDYLKAFLDKGGASSAQTQIDYLKNLGYNINYTKKTRGQDVQNFFSSLDTNKDLAQEILGKVGLGTDKDKLKLVGESTNPASGVTAEMRANDPEATAAQYEKIDPQTPPQPQGGLLDATSQTLLQGQPAQPTALPTSNYTGPSIVDYLESIGQNSSFASRKKLAAERGIAGYTGSATQNTQLLNSLRTSGGSSSAPVSPTVTSAPLQQNLTAQTGETYKPKTTTGKTEVQNVIDTYSQVVKELDLPDIKDRLNETLKEQQKLTDQMNDEIIEVNNNPWLSEAQRVKKVNSVKTKYETRLDTYSNFVKYYEALYDEGEQTARSLVGQVETNINKAIETAQKKIDAASKLGPGIIGEYEYAKSQGYTGTFIQYQNEDANRKEKASGGVSKPTEGDKEVGDLNSIQSQLLQSRNVGPEADGIYADPNLYARLRASARVAGTDFDKRFSYLINPASYSRLGIKGSSSLGFEDL